MTIRTLVTLVAVMSLGCNNSFCTEEVAMTAIRIHLLPMEYETYAPVTRSSIETEATCQFTQGIGGAVGLLRRLLKEAKSGAFDNDIVRVKIVGLERRPVFIDKEGGIWRGDGKSARLTREGLAKLREVLQELERDLPEACPDEPPWQESN